MNTVHLFYEDLQNYGRPEIQALAASYGLSGNYDDLLWQIAAKHAAKHRRASMPPADPEEWERQLVVLQKWLRSLGIRFTLDKLRDLDELSLFDSQLTELPQELATLTNLTHLDLNHNELSTFPPVILELEKLNKLDIVNNELTDIPVGITRLTNLKALDLTGNPLPITPPVLFTLNNLSSLELSETGLDKIPEDLFKLTNLERLHLDFNNISEIPVGLFNLERLEVLTLVDNKISELPTGFHKLTRLEELRLDDNNIRDIPLDFTLPVSLTYLNLMNNPIDEDSVLVPGTYHSSNGTMQELRKKLAERKKLHDLMVYGGHGAGLQLPPGALEALRRTWPKKAEMPKSSTGPAPLEWLLPYFAHGLGIDVPVWEALAEHYPGIQLLEKYIKGQAATIFGTKPVQDDNWQRWSTSDRSCALVLIDKELPVFFYSEFPQEPFIRLLDIRDTNLYGELTFIADKPGSVRWVWIELAEKKGEGVSTDIDQLKRVVDEFMSACKR